MQTQPLDFVGDNARTGFRLRRLEVFNWGTFDRHIWRIEPGGENSLLTGDIGSGKSTLVDAITTLLVPHHRIVYNKAAGAESKERSLYSYLRGEYKSEKDDLTQAAKAVPLRDDNSYTVLLAYFHNEGFDQGVTLAQVFWLKDQQRNPERFFVIAQAALTIADQFGGFGTDILDLKRRLRRTPRVEVLDNFKEYGGRFRHLFGIPNEQALELFYQTVSMKSVGNLTEFVRNHMLEAGEVESRIEELRRNFDNLNHAHDAVLKAKRQIDLLTPLVTDGERYLDLNRAIEELRQSREALVAYFARHKVELLVQHIEKLDLEIKKLAHRLDTVKQELNHMRQQESGLKTSMDDHGGRRLQALEQEITTLTTERVRKESKAEEHRKLAEQIGLTAARSEEDFYRHRQETERLLQQAEETLNRLVKEQVDKSVDLKGLQTKHDGLGAELASLRGRRSNIPLKNLEIRRNMIETLGLAEDALPFVGELLQVDEHETEWEGAIERLLHGFGLSLLVPEQLYAQVSRYVERTRLQGRLVYFRVREHDNKPMDRNPDARSLVRKLRIKPDSAFYTWLERDLAERFDYLCCDTLEEFHHLPHAVTRNGQIKYGGRRHEKDDRRSIHDRSHYVLGWSNENKIEALEVQQRQLEREAQHLADSLGQIQKQQQAFTARRDSLRDFSKIVDYNEIHWQPLAERIHALGQDKRAIEESSDILKSLRTQLEQVHRSIAENGQRESELGKEAGKLEERREASQRDLAEAQRLAGLLTPEEQQTWFPKLNELRRQALPDTTLNLQTLDKAQRDLRESIQNRLDNDDQKIKRLTEKIIKQMQGYKTDYPAETTEVDASLEALSEYGTMLTALQTQDLPRHEARFKQLLNEGTINSVALFQNQLDKEREEIEQKIRAINISLREIEYNPGTYIELVTDRTQDLEIRQFQQDLRACLAHSLDDNEMYNEAKFLQVKAIIDRFNGREGLVDLDRKWTRMVTDVRNWFNFSASERWREDGAEKEFYSDSSGKSGGQKEKLAYTILASALAYQFGLEWNTNRSRSFRFVVIDEAFGRGSDESARYGLELFKKLNLQLLIVTPLQKIHVIEDYIAAVHFVHNQDGRNSVVRNLTLEEYRAEKERYLQSAGA